MRPRKPTVGAPGRHRPSGRGPRPRNPDPRRRVRGEAPHLYGQTPGEDGGPRPGDGRRHSGGAQPEHQLVGGAHQIGPVLLMQQVRGGVQQQVRPEGERQRQRRRRDGLGDGVRPGHGLGQDPALSLIHISEPTRPY